MIKKFNKNIKFLSIFSLSYIEKYLKELVNLSFEYSSNFVLSYNINNFKSIPLNVFNLINYEEDIIGIFLYLLNFYLEKDSFYNSLYMYLNLKFKIKLNQFIQILGVRGSHNIKHGKNYILSNLNYGLTLKDFFLSSFKTRESIIDSSVNISSSGYLTRKLVEGLRDINIKEIKCTTKYSYKNDFLNEYFNSPFLCINNKSVCLFCMNVSNTYNMYLGYNKGVVSGQALGEPSTQMLLRTFHLGSGNVGGSLIGYNKSDFKVKYNFYKNNNKIFFFNLFSHKNNIILFNYNSYYNIKINDYGILKKIFYNYNVTILILYNNFSKLWNLLSLDNVFVNVNYKIKKYYKDKKNCFYYKY